MSGLIVDSTLRPQNPGEPSEHLEESPPLPKAGEEIELQFEGDLKAVVISHHEDGSITVLVPSFEVQLTAPDEPGEWAFSEWE